ncbi:MAG: ATP-binding protein [Bacteroidales bacterium]|nr:ATP-binding protein [Bacteroidales bacterium]MCF8337323.1 ATP-binding protein [Bacteroidales bacterium]
MIIERHITNRIEQSLKKFPIVSLTGPRQSGKTTLLKNAFPDFEYFNLERIDHYDLIVSDPIGVLKYKGNGIIIDEAQRYPDIFRTIQVLSDEQNLNGQYILSGSQSFLMNEKISQSLAGRVRIHHLFPFDISEIETIHKTSSINAIYSGFYPRVLINDIEPEEFYPSYIQTYIERDIRSLQSIDNLRTFNRFLGLCAGRTGQVLNISGLANDTGISVNTAKRWLSLLETSFIVYFLQPYHNNLNKRLIKSPKLYFYDTGLVASLLRINDPEYISKHYHYGSLFENLVVSEIIKYYYHQGKSPAVYYWRDSAGVEIDCVIEKNPQNLVTLEIKAGETFTKDYLKNLNRFDKILSGNIENQKMVVYNGEQDMEINQTRLVPWYNFPEKLKHLIR